MDLNISTLWIFNFFNDFIVIIIVSTVNNDDNYDNDDSDSDDYLTKSKRKCNDFRATGFGISTFIPKYNDNNKSKNNK